MKINNCVKNSKFLLSASSIIITRLSRFFLVLNPDLTSCLPPLSLLPYILSDSLQGDTQILHPIMEPFFGSGCLSTIGRGYMVSITIRTEEKIKESLEGAGEKMVTRRRTEGVTRTSK
jgi:hypothetical protein